MAEPSLRTVTRTQGNNARLKDRRVAPEGYVLDFEEVDPLIRAFRRMVREAAYDVCEMAITTYLCARAHGKRMTAIPVFLVRAFHHGAIVVNRKAGIASPKDLEGRRVGVNRGYTVTTGVWARGVLASEYGADLDRVQWVLSGDEHVAEYRPPANVTPMAEGKDMAEMVISGELAGAVGVEIDHPDVGPLIPDALETGLKALEARGHYPINHAVVIRDELIARDPALATAVFEAFAEAKRLYVEDLRAERIENPTAADRLHARVMEITGADPLPYGIEPNRAALEELIGHAVSQRIIDRPVDVEELFALDTRRLVG